MLERLGGLLGLRPSTLSSLFVARLSSVSRNRDIDSNVSEAAEEQNARRRLRYNSDAAHRERRLAQARAWKAKDPERARLSQRTSQYKFYRNPAFRQKNIEQALRRYHEFGRKDPVDQHRRRLYSWVHRQFDIMSTLPWKTHRPLFQETKVEHFCQGCRLAKHGGSKVWWQQLDAEDQYYCPACYAKDIDASMPEGFEGITKWTDMVARKKELDALGPSNKPKP